MFSVALRYFDLKKCSFKLSPCFYADFKEIRENVSQNIANILSKYKLDFVLLSAYLTGSESVNFGEFHFVDKFCIRENEESCLISVIYML